MEWAEILSVVLGLLTVFVGIQWVAVKSLFRATANLLTTVSDAVEDDQLTREEVKEIAATATELLKAFQGIRGK
uniref:Uncharacterized protein n=1 Tax=viral metagenome TaxID=1070528 RepID=A0A6H1ZNB3_9ZZZZ